MGRQFRSRADRLAGNDPVTEAVVPDPDNGGVFHRCGSHIAHSPVGSRYQKTGPSEPVDAPPQRKRPVRGAGLRHAVVGPFRNIAGDITSVALGPPALPQVSGHFRHTGNHPFDLFVIHNSAYGWKKYRKNKQDQTRRQHRHRHPAAAAPFMQNNSPHIGKDDIKRHEDRP